MINCFDKEYAFLSNFYCENCQDIVGKNKLGKLLIQVRSEIRDGKHETNA